MNLEPGEDLRCRLPRASISASALVTEARRWLDTPYLHKGRTIGRAADCAAPIVWLAHVAGIEYDESLNYGKVPHPGRMRAVLEKHLVSVPWHLMQDADVLFLSWKEQPHHLAIKTPVGMLHAFNLIGKVVEHPISDDWNRRIRGVYRFPGVE